jgi:hypothetical protein
MGALKNFYFEQICKMDELELQNAIDLDTEYWNRREEDAQIIRRAEELECSEMPNFLR